MSTARASSVFLLSYRNTVLNQSACIFALGYFLTIIVLHLTFHFKIFYVNRWIMYIEKKICECDGTIIMYHENIRRIKRR